MKLKFLGTGTSTGIPQIGCNCETCISDDIRDKRLRSSVLVELDNSKNILIDCGPDFYHQIISAGSPHIDALLLTHLHYDHIGGIEDLRPYCYPAPLPVYCTQEIAEGLQSRLSYCFTSQHYPGSIILDLNIIKDFQSFECCDTTILPLIVSHYQTDVTVFKIGKLAYVTDCKVMPQKTITELKGIDTLIINALRIRPHLSHQNLEEALHLISLINPRVAYLTHISHDMGKHADFSAKLPPNVFCAYDGLTIIC